MKNKQLVYGVGVNDANYVVQQHEYLGRGVDGKVKRNLVWACPFYEQWKSMIGRCYSDKWKEKYPTYNNVVCCGEWLVFSKFKQWMKEQDYQEKQLDKDIIFIGNKIYSSATCAFVLPKTNKFVIACDASRGEWPLGTSYDKAAEKFRARCRNPFTAKEEHLGYFTTPEAAHEAWRQRKYELAQLIAETESDPRVVEALKKRYNSEEWYKHSLI